MKNRFYYILFINFAGRKEDRRKNMMLKVLLNITNGVNSKIIDDINILIAPDLRTIDEIFYWIRFRTKIICPIEFCSVFQWSNHAD